MLKCINIVVTFFFYSSLVNAQIDPNQFRDEVHTKVSSFIHAIKYISNCNFLDTTRRMKIRQTKDIFIDDAKIEVLPKPGAKIISQPVQIYLNRVFNYCNKYKMSIINIKYVKRPLKFEPIIYRDKAAFRTSCEYIQCTTFFEVKPDLEVPKLVPIQRKECTTKYIEVYLVQEQGPEGAHWEVLLAGVKVLDGEY